MCIGTSTTLLLLVAFIDACLGCPESCVCKWKNGKQTVECVNKNLLVIPEGMDSGTQVLEFSGNNLQTLHREKFLRLDLINLQRIYLSRCRITSIDERAFNGLTNLVELDLSSNLLEAVPTESFLDCPSLMRLILNSNPIRTVRRAAFNHLSLLSTLELSNCKITKVEEGAFQSLYSLEWIHLDGNKMAALKGTRYFPQTLKGVQLQDNPWECDCHMLDLHSWLKSFPIPLSADPICTGPHRLEGRIIKSVPESDLACLPDVSPTTFYLEIGEGKNVSLLCQVHAIPEARVSWWFQGQLLQNDSMVAPGVHLLYYLEEGTVEKRSELFIYNTNTDDNGTFICNAENPAGSTQANFTIRVVVKHEINLDQNELPFEFILIVMSAAAVSVLLFLSVVVLFIIKCQRNKRIKKKRSNSKAALSNTSKDNAVQDRQRYEDGVKDGVNIKLVSHKEATILYTAQPKEELLRTMSPVAVANQLKSPTSLRRYQLEQNPDLINGTETIGRQRECDSIAAHPSATAGPYPAAPVIACGFPAAAPVGRDLYVLAPDVHLNPVGLLNPADPRAQQYCYRTLPYNRGNKRQSAANPISRFSREAEFLSRSSQPASFEHYCGDVRYTADGYPVRTQQNSIAAAPSPESHNSDSVASSTEPCCSSGKIKWPSCVPANICSASNKVSVVAQTQTESSETAASSGVKLSNKLLSNVSSVQETLKESPDETCDGENTETNTCQCENK